MDQDRRSPVAAVQAVVGMTDATRQHAAPPPAERVTRFAPDIEIVWRLRKAARHAREQGELKGARDLYRQLVERLVDDGDALHWLGVLEHRLGRPAAGRACLARAVAVSPRSVPRRFALAEMLRTCGATSEALEHYAVATALAPADAAIRRGLGLNFLALGRVDEAVQTLGQARLLAPDDAGIRADLEAACAEAACGAGRRLRRLQHWAAAAVCYRRALELVPGHCHALVDLDFCLARLEMRPSVAMADA